MRNSIRTSSLAHMEVMKQTKEKAYEYQLQSLFESYCTSCGLKWQAYHPIVGAGKRGAVLHYVDNDQTIPVAPNPNMVLIDAGGEYFGYETDITRTYPGNGKFSNDQKMIYQTVLNAQKAAIETLKKGSFWSDAVKISLIKILEGLKKHGFIDGDIEQMYNTKVHSLFMLHSLGHSLGLNRDPLVLSKLEENMVLTVEPGIYFHDFIFKKATQEQKKYLNMKIIEKFYNFGGVRIEDCLRITSTGYENLSGILPKEMDDIERLMTK